MLVTRNRTDAENQKIIINAQNRATEMMNKGRIDRSDAYGFAPESIRSISPDLIETREPAKPWQDRLIPEDPWTPTGSHSLVYTRVHYTSEWSPMGDGSATSVGLSDAVPGSISYNSRYYEGYLRYTIADVDRLASAQSEGDFAAEISVVRQKVEAVQRGWRKLLNEIFSKGKPREGLVGILNHPDVPRLNLGTALGPGASPEENLSDLNQIERAIATVSRTTEMPDTIVLPTTTFYDLKGQIFSSGGETSVLNRYLSNSPSVKNADVAPELEQEHNGSGNFIFMFSRDPMKICRVVPKTVTFMPPQQEGNGYKVYAHGQVSGVHIKYPFSCMLAQFNPA